MQSVIDHLQTLNANFEQIECDPDLADTAAFCEAYGYSAEESANAILIYSKRPAGQLGLCMALANTRLDVNRAVRDAMGVKKLSFASSDQTMDATGMMIGGVTPFGIEEQIPLYVDAAVMEQEMVIVGGGSRSLKIRVDPEVFDRMPNAQIVAGLAARLGHPPQVPEVREWRCNERHKPRTSDGSRCRSTAIGRARPRHRSRHGEA